MTMMNTHARVLVVDDAPQVHRVLRPSMQVENYDMESAATGTEAVRLMRARSPNVILLDLGLPDLDGLEVLVRLRELTTVPIIILSGRSSEAEKIAALDRGADDYIVKPFDIGELLARIRACLRRCVTPLERLETLTFENLEINLASRTVRVSGDTVALTPKEWSLLTLLASNPDAVFSHRQILSAIWGPAYSDSIQYLRIYMRALRKKLGSAKQLIRTETGVGYRLATNSGPLL
jgi:two-component system KDP operon response regulator KdpE